MGKRHYITFQWMIHIVTQYLELFIFVTKVIVRTEVKIGDLQFFIFEVEHMFILPIKITF